jgi:hypothetical protein
MLKTDGFGGLAREGGTSCTTREYIIYQKTHFVTVVSIWLRATVQLNEEIKPRTMTHLSDGHLDSYMQITTEIKPNIGQLMKQKPCQISTRLMTDFDKDNFK